MTEKLDNWSPEISALWAKTGDVDSGDWMNLPRHMMDSLEVANYLWEHWLPEGTKNFLAAQTGLEFVQIQKLVRFLAGIHDLGKADPGFSAQLSGQPDRSAYIDRMVRAGFELKPPELREDSYPHSVGSFHFLGTILKEDAENLDRSSRRKLEKVYQLVAEIVGAHHGLPVSEEFERRVKAHAPRQHQLWFSVRREAVDAIKHMSGFDQARDLPQDPRRMSRPVQMILTGLVIMADWIASDQSLFPLNSVPSQSSHERLMEARYQLELPQAKIPREFPEDVAKGYRDRFGWSSSQIPFNTQVELVKAVQQLQGASLVVLEADTGSGKTEAALAAAEVFANRTGRFGVMFAAPTTATSDALFRRVKQWAQSYTTEDVSSLYLGHSKNFLNPGLKSLLAKQSRFSSIGLDEAESFASASADDDKVIAHQWLYGRKKGMLADVVVGTVDQVLLMALQSKHAMLRHLGLSNKVVIVDEIHAYDSYMSAYLGRALQWLAAYQVPVILLSATLPHLIKAQLVASYQKGLVARDVRPDSVPNSGNAYPVITVAHKHGVDLVSVDPEKRPEKKVQIRSIGENQKEFEKLLDRVELEGGNLLILCNTVARAQETFEQVRDRGVDAQLLHAGFVAQDRVRKEQQLVEQLGPKLDLDSGRPKRSIVVATQVVEQSLDVDFDALITDIAPMDLMIQRIGRVHRHSRPSSDRPAWTHNIVMHVRGVTNLEDVEAPPEFVPAIEKIYQRSVLMNTWALLRERSNFTEGALSLPRDIPALVEATYASQNAGPDSWGLAYSLADQEMEIARREAIARAQTYMFPEPYGPIAMRDLWNRQEKDVSNNAVSEAEGSAQVRDSEPSLEVCLVQAEGCETSYRPLPHLFPELDPVFAGQVPDSVTATAIATSSVRLPYIFSASRELFDQSLHQLEANTDPAWRESPELRGQLQLCLDENGRAVVAGRSLLYDYEFGLIDETPRQPPQSKN